MSVQEKLLIKFAGLEICFVFPTEQIIPKEFIPFQDKGIKERNNPDTTYEIELLSEPLRLPEQPIMSYGDMRIYNHSDGWLRVYSALTADDGCQVATLVRRNNQSNILYYPASKWDFYSEELHFLHLLGIEEFLLNNNALLLHSSLVQLDGQTVLFSGPSGVGKSTQASLWEKYLRADVLNGDRCVIRKIDETFYGCGSPWAGTSGIYRREMAPIKGIFILKQSKETKVRQIKAEAFVKIYQQCIVNAWDEQFVERITDLIMDLLRNVPVYEMACRPDKEAVDLAYNTLYKGGI